MSEQLQLRRGSASAISTFTGAQGEVVFDTTNNRLVAQDGSTAGGFAAAKLNETQTTQRSQANDANYSMIATDRVIAFIAITAARTVSLVAASSFQQGATLFVFDELGGCSATNTITLNRAGSDTIDGSTSVAVSVAYGFIGLQSNGANKWTVVTSAGPSATTPNMDSAAAIGSSLTYARADHAHPSDTSRAALAGSTFTGALVAAAGATFLAPLKLQSGTNLTTPAAGAFEYDGNVGYFTVQASERGVIPAEQFILLTGAYTLTSQTAAQALFNTTTNSAVTLATGTYQFECMFALNAMSATSGTFGFALGGAATIAAYWTSLAAMGSSLATATATNTTYNNNSAANAALTPNSTNGVGSALIKGIVRVTGAGTIIPQVSLSVAAAAAAQRGSYFKIAPLGASGVGSVGNWS